MVEAYVMIRTTAGTAPSLLQQIQEIDGVTRANIVAGAFDIIATIEAEDNQHLLTLITEKLQTLDGVGRTTSSIILQ